jgi:hypothetical protein
MFQRYLLRLGRKRLIAGGLAGLFTRIAFRSVSNQVRSDAQQPRPERRAEMVKAFMSSTEYRNRFGP